MISTIAMRKSVWIPFLALATAASGCASAQPPKEILSQANLAIQEASEQKAPQYAPLQLRRAREKLEGAREAMQKEDYVRARRLAEEGLVDAQLARDKAEADIAQENAAALSRAIETLRAEALRQSVPSS